MASNTMETGYKTTSTVRVRRLGLMELSTLENTLGDEDKEMESSFGVH